MSQGRKKEIDPDKALYLTQNKAIHQARAQLCMELDDCRELARQISGEPSISSLSIKQRSELIKILKSKGAKVYNPPLSKAQKNMKGEEKKPSPGIDINPVDVFPERLEYWDKKFQKDRPGYATNKQLAMIETLWMLDWDDGRTDSDKGLRGFIFRQTKNSEQGPVSHLAFLKEDQVEKILGPLKKRMQK